MECICDEIDNRSTHEASQKAALRLSWSESCRLVGDSNDVESVGEPYSDPYPDTIRFPISKQFIDIVNSI